MLEELQRRNYTTDTIRGYILAVEQFARYFHKSPELMGAEEIGQFQLHLLREQKLAVGTIVLRMGALRFLYKKTLKRRDLDFDDLPLLKKPKKLPVVLSLEEVTRLIEAAPNGAGLEQELEQYFLVLPHERNQRVRHAEDQVVVARR